MVSFLCVCLLCLNRSFFCTRLLNFVACINESRARLIILRAAFSMPISSTKKSKINHNKKRINRETGVNLWSIIQEVFLVEKEPKWLLLSFLQSCLSIDKNKREGSQNSNGCDHNRNKSKCFCSRFSIVVARRRQIGLLFLFRLFLFCHLFMIRQEGVLFKCINHSVAASCISFL